MKLLKRLITSDGEVQIKLLVENVEDLWHLFNFLTPGDSITTKSRRKVQHDNGVSILGNSIKVLTLEIEITEINFSPQEIRINGTNKTESEFLRLGAHHAVTVVHQPPQEVLIKKNEWNEVLEERLKDCCLTKHTYTPVVLMTYGNAEIAMLHSSIIEIKCQIKTTIAKKRQADGTARDKSILKFFKQVMEALVRYVDFETAKCVILASPGRVRDEFFAFLKKKTQHDNPSERALAQLLPKFNLLKINTLSHDGIREALRNPAVAKDLQSKRSQNEVREWDRFQTMLSKHPDRCVYTPQLVFCAVKLGAVSSLLINDSVFRSPDPLVRRFFLAIAQNVRHVGGTTVTVFSSNYVTGDQLSMLGDVAATLSYDCPELDDIVPDHAFLSSGEVEEFLRTEKLTKVTI